MARDEIHNLASIATLEEIGRIRKKAKELKESGEIDNEAHYVTSMLLITQLIFSVSIDAKLTEIMRWIEDADGEDSFDWDAVFPKTIFP